MTIIVIEMFYYLVLMIRKEVFLKKSEDKVFFKSIENRLFLRSIENKDVLIN